MRALLRPGNAYRLGIACAALAAASLAAPQVRAEEITKSYTVAGRANVHVETNDGSVRVTSGDSKQVEFRVEYQGYELGRNLTVDSRQDRSEEHTSNSSHVEISYAVFCLKKKKI